MTGRSTTGTGNSNGSEVLAGVIGLDLADMPKPSRGGKKANLSAELLTALDSAVKSRQFVWLPVQDNQKALTNTQVKVRTWAKANAQGTPSFRTCTPAFRAALIAKGVTPPVTKGDQVLSCVHIPAADESATAK